MYYTESDQNKNNKKNEKSVKKYLEHSNKIINKAIQNAERKLYFKEKNKLILINLQKSIF